LSQAQIAWDYNRGKPIASWDFDECQGTALNSSTGTMSATLSVGSGGGEDTVGTCTTASTAWGSGATGKFNYSVDLDGTDDAIYALSPGLPTNDFTASAWVNLGTATDETILMASRTGGDELRVHVNSSGQIELYTAGVLRATSAQTISTGSWTNITVASSSGTQKIFINGRQDANTGSGTTQMNFAGCSLWIGTDVDSGCGGSLGNYMDGQIDEVQIFNYGLTDVQIRNLYNQSAAVRFGPATGAP
ncbi:MAG: LamG domain-containing protein, partial [Candidatus Levybacteria bacterium]|nr:LamG domain-containing protein [Candidatus Levybacteria bacterium]